MWIPHLRKYLCRKHFIEYFERRVSKTVEKYRMLKGVERLIIAVSGGKDSVALLHAMHRLYSGSIEIIGVTIDLGIQGYSGELVSSARRNYEELGIDYTIIDLEREYGFTIDDAARHRRALRRPICSVCGIVKRYILNKAALELGADAVATGHNLDDLAKFTFASLASGRPGDLVKLVPRTPGRDGLVSRIKPLAMIRGWEAKLYVEALEAPYHAGKCPYAPSRGLQVSIARALGVLEEESPGALAMYYSNIVAHLVPRIKGEEPAMTKCEICGMPSSSRICSFCRIRSRLTGFLRESS